ncbi:MAG: hypothetical protein IJ333_08735 [Clostridia bacterium]|nr:hypothetical protein [Clostridia bacterium]
MTAYVVNGEILDEAVSFLADTSATIQHLEPAKDLRKPEYFLLNPSAPLSSFERHSMDVVISSLEYQKYGGHLFFK